MWFHLSTVPMNRDLVLVSVNNSMGSGGQVSRTVSNPTISPMAAVWGFVMNSGEFVLPLPEWQAAAEARAYRTWNKRRTAGWSVWAILQITSPLQRPCLFSAQGPTLWLLNWSAAGSGSVLTGRLTRIVWVNTTCNINGRKKKEKRRSSRPNHASLIHSGPDLLSRVPLSCRSDAFSPDIQYACVFTQQERACRCHRGFAHCSYSPHSTCI